MKSCFFLVALFLALSAFAAADSFAALTVTPSGPQTLDISTGVTTLPDGGEIVDKERGIRVQSDFIRYLEGAYIEAKGATVTGDFGTLTSEQVRFDLQSNTVEAEGDLQLDGEGMSVRADELLMDLDAQVARLAGHVTSSAPALEADALIMKLDAPDVLLVAPYQFVNGPLTLRQDKGGNLLQLTREVGPDGRSVYRPSTTIGADVLASLSPYLNH